MSNPNGHDDDEREKLPSGFRELDESERNPLTGGKPHNGSEVCPKCGQVHKGCTAHSKHRDGSGKLVPCKQVNGLNPVTRKCYKHGGTTPVGVASPHFRHGRRSRYARDVPKEIASGYRSALKDEKLLSMDEEVAVLQGRVGELLRDLSKTEAPPWGKVVDLLWNYGRHRDDRNPARANKAFAKLAQAIRQGADAAESHERIWTDLLDVISLKSKVAAQEHRREIDLNCYIASDKAIMLFNAMLYITKETLLDKIEDEQQAKRLMSEIALKVYRMLPTSHTVIDNEPA
jgi:hypothetical protein